MCWDRRGACMVLVWNSDGLKTGDQLEHQDVDGTIILKWIYKKLDGVTWTGLIWRRIGTGGGLW